MKLRRDKRDWLEHECSLITEANVERKSNKLLANLKKKKLKPISIYIKKLSLNDINSTTLTGKRDMLKRWTEG